MTRNILGTLALLGILGLIAWSGREPKPEPEPFREPTRAEACAVYEKVWHVPCPNPPERTPNYYPPRGEYLDI